MTDPYDEHGFEAALNRDTRELIETAVDVSDN